MPHGSFREDDSACKQQSPVGKPGSACLHVPDQFNAVAHTTMTGLKDAFRKQLSAQRQSVCVIAPFFSNQKRGLRLATFSAIWLFFYF